MKKLEETKEKVIKYNKYQRAVKAMCKLFINY